jgi:hypothetical protein
VELVVGQILEIATRSAQGVVELVVRIIHLIDTEHGFQTAFVEGLVVGHEGQTFDKWFYLCPHLGKYGGFLSIFTAETMHLAAPIVIVVGLWLYERIEGIDNLAVPDNDNAHRTNGATLVVGCFEIYSCKI